MGHEEEKQDATTTISRDEDETVFI